MKKAFFSIIFLLAAVVVMAVPAKRGMWTTITLADGSQVKAELCGDEFCHYYLTADGTAYAMNVDKRYEKADVHKLIEAVAPLRKEMNERRMERFEKNFGTPAENLLGKDNADGRRKAIGDFNEMTGVKKGIVILINFSDLKFTETHTPDFYKTMLNEGGPASMGYVGSVKQYFSDQSNGRFVLDFDVAYTYEAPEGYKYYGGELSNSTALSRVRTLFTDAVKNAPADIDWKQYDWDGDGYVDQVFFLYAGFGAASVGDESIRYDYIWPHESTLSAIPVGEVKVHTYACSNELMWSSDPYYVTDSGIGTFCHEFSHCLGYPDLYDIDYKCETTGMDYWDVLDQGSYAGRGFAPVPFTLFERMAAGWYEPTELKANKKYTMRPVTEADGGDMYIIRNPKNENEMYFFECIKNEGWCSGLYRSKGLLAVYVDYDKKAWANNKVNCLLNKSLTDHPRYTYIPADGSYVIEKTSDIRGDLYGVNGNKTFSAKWHDGTDCAIRLKDIQILDDGTVAFATEGDVPDAINAIVAKGEVAGKTFNIAGQEVGSAYKGLVIKDGKKVLK